MLVSTTIKRRPRAGRSDGAHPRYRQLSTGLILWRHLWSKYSKSVPAGWLAVHHQRFNQRFTRKSPRSSALWRALPAQAQAQTQAVPTAGPRWSWPRPPCRQSATAVPSLSAIAVCRASHLIPKPRLPFQSRGGRPFSRLQHWFFESRKASMRHWYPTEAPLSHKNVYKYINMLRSILV